jgi:hypothetical protein
MKKICEICGKEISKVKGTNKRWYDQTEEWVYVHDSQRCAGTWDELHTIKDDIQEEPWE